MDSVSLCLCVVLPIMVEWPWIGIGLVVVAPALSQFLPSGILKQLAPTQTLFHDLVLPGLIFHSVLGRILETNHEPNWPMPGDVHKIPSFGVSFTSGLLCCMRELR